MKIVDLFYSESIFGYKDLTVEMYFTAAKLIPYINLQYITKIVPELHEGLQVCKSVS